MTSFTFRGFIKVGFQKPALLRAGACNQIQFSHLIHFPCFGGLGLRALTHSAFIRKILLPSSVKPSEKFIRATNY